MTKHYSKKAPNIVTEISAEVDNFFCLVSFSIHFLSLCLNFSFIFSKFTERLIHVHTKIISKWSDIYCGVSFETDFKAFIIFFFPLSRLGGKKQTNKTQVHNFINLKYLEKIAKKKIQPVQICSSLSQSKSIFKFHVLFLPNCMEDKPTQKTRKEFGLAFSLHCSSVVPGAL